MTNLNALRPYQKHLTQFSTSSTSPYKVTILSALKRLLSLGLNFPISFSIAIGLPIICNPFPFYWRPVNIVNLQGNSVRSQLENVKIDMIHSYSLKEIINLYNIDKQFKSNENKGWISSMIDLGHVISFWCMAAERKSGLVSSDDLIRFQSGEWTDEIVKRRKSRLNGKSDIIPPWRGGPVIVSLHSWFVRLLFGVHVYEAK